MDKIQKLKPEDYGLELSLAQEIEKAFQPMIVERNGYVQIYEQIINSEITPELCKKAGEVRKKLVKVRTGIAGIHKTQKAYFLAAGRFVDAWKNKETLPGMQMEENLLVFEEHYERLEQRRIKKLYDVRSKLLEPFEMETIPENLGNMKEQEFEFFLEGVKSSYEKKKESERIQAEEEAEKKRRMDKLFKLGLKWDGQQFTCEDVNYHWTELATQTKEEFDVTFSKIEKRKKEIDTEAENLRKENERLRREKELSTKKEAPVINEGLGDEEKFKSLVNDLEALKSKYTFKNPANQEKYSGIGYMLDRVIILVKSKA